MAYDYLGLTNDVLKEFNEVNITATDFDTVIGFHALIKDRINTAILDIYAEEDDNWSFAYTTTSQVLTVGFTGNVRGAIPSYTLPAGFANVDWESFYIPYDSALDDPEFRHLRLLAWETYRDHYRDNDANQPTSGSFGKPDFIVRRPDNTWVVTPLANATYTVNFSYFATPTLLVNATDVPVIPEMYRQVIVDKAVYYGYMFRDNVEQAQVAEDRYTNGVNRMRRALIPQADTIRFLD